MSVKTVVKAVVALVRGVIVKEPVVVGAVVTSAVVALAGAFGLVLDAQSVTAVVAEVLVILAGGAAVRSKVTPV